MPCLNADSIVKKITANSPAKTISLFLAIFLFAFHNLNLLKTKTISSQLHAEGYTDLILTSILPENVSVTLRGNERSLDGISEKDIITFIDLTPYTAKGSYRVPVKVIKSGASLNAEALEISVEPVDIMLQFDNTAEKHITISPTVSGSPAEGYDIVSEKLTPGQLKVEGPASLLSRINTITTEPVDISDRYNDFSVLLNIVSPGRLFTIHGGNTVEYSAKISPAYIAKKFSGITLTALNLNEAFAAKITPETGSVTLRGPYNDVIKFSNENIPLTADCSGIDDEGVFTLPVNIGGDYAETPEYEPKEAEVTITKRADT
jgi:YbbR domain-containing protein